MYMTEATHSTYRILGIKDELDISRYTTNIHIFDTFLYPVDVVEEQWVEQWNSESGLFDIVLVRYRTIRLGADVPCDNIVQVWDQEKAGLFDRHPNVCSRRNNTGAMLREVNPAWTEVTAQ